MLSNEIFALACRAYYDEEGIVVDASNGQFAHSPLTRKECDTGYYLLWEHHQHQGLLQSRDLDKCCFFSGDTLKWLVECDYWPEGYFELWDIYEQYAGQAVRKTVERMFAEKNSEGKSTRAVQNAKRMLEVLHREKDEFGRSLSGVKAAERLHAEKDSSGKSVMARKAGKERAKTLNSEKDVEGKSVNAVKAGKRGGKTSGSQVWESIVDGFRSNAGAVAHHNKANGWDPAARVRIS